MSKQEPGKGISRRLFLKGTALSGAVKAAFPSAAQAAGNASQNTKKGASEHLLSMRINGEKRQVRVHTDETLADALRDHLQLTGTKIACDRGACGACTVLVDGVPRAACMSLAVDLDEATIETVEGLASSKGLGTLQKQFIDNDAMQCGYCIPGFLMAGTALIRNKPDATVEDIREALSGNLCRCGSQPHIVQAIENTLRGESGRRSP